MSIEAAEGFADLELWEEAWEALEELDPDDRAGPEVIRLRMRCAVGLERWGMVQTLAQLLRHGGEVDRKAAAQAFQLLAVVSIRVHRLDLAKAYVTSAIDTWPDIRIEILDDPLLSEHLL